MNWNAGYVTEIEYIHGYYRELCPSLLRLACLSAGVAPPSHKPLTYLELGYGQGLTINIHAAANPGAFWGTDFNPSQAATARTMAEASGAPATLFDDSFAELAARPDLPEFDMIVMHGIWAWVSDQNNQIILDLIRRKLRVGGLVYVSYNCLPGWAPAMPLRHLMKLHADLGGAEGTGLLAKLDGAIGFAKQVVDSGASYFRANPAVGERLKYISTMHRHYVAHEYLNDEWKLMPFSAVAEAFDHAKVSFVCSAHLLDQVDAINLKPEAQSLLASITSPILKQSVRDYFVNQQFRRDIFVKGPRQLTQLDQVELMRREKFVLSTLAENVPLKVTGALGEATFPEEFYGPVVEVLAQDNYAPKTLQQIAAHANLKSMPYAHLVQAILLLVGSGHAQAAQAADAATRKQCRALNELLCVRARSSDEIGALASPVTGGGIKVSRFEQIFLLAMWQQGLTKEIDLANFLWTILSAQGQRLLKEGKAVESAEENLNELTKMAHHFVSATLPLLKVLEVA